MASAGSFASVTCACCEPALLEGWTCCILVLGCEQISQETMLGPRAANTEPVSDCSEASVRLVLSAHIKEQIPVLLPGLCPSMSPSIS